MSTGTWDGTSAINRGLYVNATGGTVNYSAIFEGGNVGVMNTAPDSALATTGGGSFTGGLRVDKNVTASTISITGTRPATPTAGTMYFSFSGGADADTMWVYNGSAWRYQLLIDP